MAEVSIVSIPSKFLDNALFVQDVTIYGILNYRKLELEEFNNVRIDDNFEVSGISSFYGDAYFYNSIYFEDISAGIVTVRKRLDVGVGGTILTTSTGNIGIGTTVPRQRLDVIGTAIASGSIGIGITIPRQKLDVVGTSIVSGNLGVGIDVPRQKLDVVGTSIVSGRIGIGSTIPEQKLDAAGSVKIDQFIYDSVNSPGDNQWYLSRDEAGIRWVQVSPGDVLLGIYLQDEGVYVPTTGTAQTFTTLNFVQRNSLGLGTDTLIPTAKRNDVQTGFATIFTQDLWGHTDGGNIYRMTNVGIQNNNPSVALDVIGDFRVSGNSRITQTLNVGAATTLQSFLNVGAAATFQTTVNVKGATNLENTLNVGAATTLQSFLNVGAAATFQTTVNVKGATNLENTLNVGAAGTFQTTLNVKEHTSLEKTLNVGLAGTFQTTLNVKGATDLESTLNVDGATTLQNTLDVKEHTDLEKTLMVGAAATFKGSIELDSSLVDQNNSSAAGKFDYRLSSVGTGVSWRPPGVQTQNAIWVTMDGNDTNSGFLEGDAKRTIGAAASIAQEGDTIFVRSGVYIENNPIGLRTDVSVSGQDLRLVTVIPLNPTRDVFHVRRGCLIENLSFAGSTISIAHTGAGAVAFPPTQTDVNAGISSRAVTGYLAFGPATEGSTGRWKSPYVRNCTNFMTKSIGMKINGNHATASTIGGDLKCMVCDSFTQYNENGIGVSITNNGYAQLVSIFTINSDIGIYCASGGSCDLTNSNSSFGNYGLVAVGLGNTEFTAGVGTYPSTRTQPGVDAGSDKVTFLNVSDEFANPRRPYDGQALFFKIDLRNYPDAVTTGLTTTILQEPMRFVDSIKVSAGGTGFSAASPPTVVIRDVSDQSQQPRGPQGIIAEVSPTVDPITGSIIAIDVVNSGRNYLPTQQLEVFIDGGVAAGATATVVTQPIYYTVDTATAPTPGTGRFQDAANLIEKNLDFIAAEAMDRTYKQFPSFSTPGLGTSRCITDLKLVLRAINYNLVFDGNDRVYDAAKFYIDNAVLAGEETQSVYAFESLIGITTYIMRNETVTKIGGTSPYNTNPNNTFTQYKDLTVVVDPITPYCSNVASAIVSLVGIVTTAIATNVIPASRTVGTRVGISTVTFNEFIPYELFGGEQVSMKRISRILTSSHSFEYIGTGTSINTSTPFKGAVPIKDNEIVALDGAQVPFTSTDQKGNFDIGEGFQINQPTATIRGRDFSKAIQAEVTPLILALR